MKMKALFVFLVVMIPVLKLVGQDTIIHLTLGTSGQESSVKAFEDSESYWFFGSTGGVGHGESDIYIVRSDKLMINFEIETIGSGAIETLKDVIMLDSGGFILLSQTYDGFASLGYGLRLDKINGNGEVQSTIVINEEGYQHPIAMSVNGSGAIGVLFMNTNAVAGYSILLIDSMLNVNENIDIDSYGMLDDISLVDILYESASIFVIGDGSSSILGRQAVLLEFDMVGELINGYTFGDTLDEFGSSIIRASDSTLLITGSSNSAYENDFDVYITMVSNWGYQYWSKFLGWNPNFANKDEFGTESLMGSDGLIYAGATTRTYGEGGVDFHCYVIDTDGGYIDGNSFGMKNDEILTSFIQLSDSGFIMFGTTNTLGFGLTDFFIVKTPQISFGPVKTYKEFFDSSTEVNSSVGISENQVVNQSIIEVNDGFSLGFTNCEKYYVFNQSGQLIHHEHLGGSGRWTATTSGLYFIIAFDDEGNTQKMKFLSF